MNNIRVTTMKKVKYAGLLCMLISAITSIITYFLLAPNWTIILLIVLPLAILLLSFFNSVAGGSTALVLSLFSLVFLLMGGGDLDSGFRNAMIGVSSLFLAGGILIFIHAVKVTD